MVNDTLFLSVIKIIDYSILVRRLKRVDLL